MVKSWENDLVVGTLTYSKGRQRDRTTSPSQSRPYLPPSSDEDDHHDNEDDRDDNEDNDHDNADYNHDNEGDHDNEDDGDQNDKSNVDDKPKVDIDEDNRQSRSS